MSEAWRYESLGQPGSEHTRSAILHAAASLAAVDGLENVSIADAALIVGMSKAGVRALFGSGQKLQLAVVEEAARIFGEEVVRPALAASPGLAQLTAVCEAFFRYLERRTFPGDCFMVGLAPEVGNRPGPVIELIVQCQTQFGALIRGFADAALAREELPAGEDPGQLAFELNGIMLATDTNFTENHDPAVLELARQIVRSRLQPTRR